MGARPPDEAPFVDSTAALASLYQAPSAEFIARRTALVAQLKRSGHKDVAASIASAAKPSRAAALVNQVFWQARATYDAVLEAGTAARAAQQARLLGDASTDLFDTLRLRDDAIRAAVTTALATAREGGPAVSEAIAAQVRASFEALAAHGLESRLPHGHLVTDVVLPGMAAFAGLILPTIALAPVRRFEVVARRASETTAESELPVPDPRIAAAEGLVEQLTKRRAAAVERLEELQRSTAAAHDVATTAEAAAAEAALKAAEARRAVERADASRLAVEQDLVRVADELGMAQATVRTLRDAALPPPSPEPSRTTSGGARRPPAPQPRR